MRWLVVFIFAAALFYLLFFIFGGLNYFNGLIQQSFPWYKQYIVYNYSQLVVAIVGLAVLSVVIFAVPTRR